MPRIQQAHNTSSRRRKRSSRSRNAVSATGRKTRAAAASIAPQAQIQSQKQALHHGCRSSCNSDIEIATPAGCLMDVAVVTPENSAVGDADGRDDELLMSPSLTRDVMTNSATATGDIILPIATPSPPVVEVAEVGRVSPPCRRRRRRRIKSNSHDKNISSSSLETEINNDFDEKKEEDDLDMSFLHFQQGYASARTLFHSSKNSTNSMRKSCNYHSYAPKVSINLNNSLSAIDIFPTSYEHPKEFNGTSSRISLYNTGYYGTNNSCHSEKQRKQLGILSDSLVLYDNATYITCTTRSQVWFLDDLQGRSLCSYRCIPYNSCNSIKKKFVKACDTATTNNATECLIGHDERIVRACPSLCREVNLLTLLYQRLVKQHERIESRLQMENNYRFLIPKRILIGKKEASVELVPSSTNDNCYNREHRMATIGQYLSFSIAVGGMGLKHQKTMADLVYHIIRAVSHCHSCQISHGSLNLNCILMKELSRSSCEIFIIGFGKAGIDCSTTNNTAALYNADNIALANIIHLLLTGNQLPKDIHNIELSQYIIGKPTYEAIIHELTHPDTTALHLNKDMCDYMKILATLRHDDSSSSRSTFIPKMIEQPYIVKTRQRQQQILSSCLEDKHQSKDKYLGVYDDEQSNNLVSDVEDEPSASSTVNAKSFFGENNKKRKPIVVLLDTDSEDD